MAVGELANILNQECVSIRVWEEDGMFLAKCLDIPGCLSQGATREEALANINDAIALCIDIIKQDVDNAATDNQNHTSTEIVQRSIRDLVHT